MKYSMLAALLGLCVTTATPTFAVNTYGPTVKKETLWSIANRLRPSSDISVQQVMLALYRENPNAFVGHNINSLKKGVYLRIPNMQQIQSASRNSAMLATKRQNNAWQHKSHTKKPRRSTAKKRPTPKREIADLKQRIERLENSLSRTHRQNRRLEKQLKEAKAIQVASVAPVSLAKLQSQQEAEKQRQFNIEIAKKVQKLTAEVQVLHSVIAEKDEHIRNLKTSLKVASETIKRQHAENQRIYAELQKVRSTQVATATQVETPTQTDAVSPKLELSPVQPQAQAAKSTENTESVWADEAQANPKTETPNPSQSNLVEQSAANTGVLKLAEVDTQQLQGTNSLVRQASNDVKAVNTAPAITTESLKPEMDQAKPVHVLQEEKENSFFGLPAPSKTTLFIAVALLLGLLIFLVRSVFGRRGDAETFYTSEPRKNNQTLTPKKAEPAVESKT